MDWTWRGETLLLVLGGPTAVPIQHRDDKRMTAAGALLCTLQWVDDDVVISLKRCCYVSLCTDFQLGGKINTKMMNLS